MFLFLSGVVMAGCFVAATFFVRYRRRSGDRFFVFFAIAFALLGLERLGLAVRNAPEEPHTGMYFLRLAAFVLIIIAILDKNRGGSRDV